MSKRAEEAALKAYPVHSILIQPARCGGYYADTHLRDGFIKGYEQAEEDLLSIITAARKVFESWKAGEAWALYANMEELGNLLKDKRND